MKNPAVDERASLANDTLQRRPLLQTKLYIPPARPDLVSRPRLIERLNVGLDRNLTLISAPAGFGKTTLLSEWINSGVRSRQYEVGGEQGRTNEICPTPCSLLPTPYFLLPTPRFAWLSLDKGDNDSTRFWAYFIAALQTIHESVGEAALAALRSPQSAPIEPLLTGLINEITEIQEHSACMVCSRCDRSRYDVSPGIGRCRGCIPVCPRAGNGRLREHFP